MRSLHDWTVLHILYERRTKRKLPCPRKPSGGTWRSMPAVTPSAFARIVARTRTVKRLPRLFIQPAIVETLHVGEDVTRQLLAVCFLQAQGLMQGGGQFFQHHTLSWLAATPRSHLLSSARPTPVRNSQPS